MAGSISVSVRKKYSRLPAIAKALPVAAVVKVQRHGERVVERATVIVPVDKGNLRDTIRYEPTGATSGKVSAGGMEVNGVFVDYAGYVHDGTTKMSARPFLAQAVEDQRAEWDADWRNLGSELS